MRQLMVTMLIRKSILLLRQPTFLTTLNLLSYKQANKMRIINLKKGILSLIQLGSY